jgi:hypothetical protein
MKTPTFAYDAGDEILFVGFANLRFDSKQAIQSAFEAVRVFWKTHCASRKVYCVIDYTNVEFDDSLTEFYAGYVKRAVEEYSITTVRYTTDVHMRATLRVVGMTIHKPSNLYASREDAIQMVRALRSKQATVAK